MKKRHKKPTGQLGIVKVTGSGISTPPNKFVFPDTKNEIEKKVVSTFLELINIQEESPFPKDAVLKENEQNNLDFSLKAQDYLSFLELTEITPPGKMRGGYEALPYEHNIGEHLDKTLDLIMRKSKKYDGIETEVNLLMYITDDRSLPSISMERLLKYGLNTIEHNFVSIYAFYPLLENDGPIIQFYPAPYAELTKEEIENLKLKQVKNLKIK